VSLFFNLLPSVTKSLDILAHPSMDAFPNAILWPLFPAAPKMTDYRLWYGYIGLALGFGVAALLIIIFTTRRLGYQHCRADAKARSRKMKVNGTKV
jgi:hypothetical protein